MWNWTNWTTSKKRVERTHHFFQGSDSSSAGCSTWVNCSVTTLHHPFPGGLVKETEWKLFKMTWFLTSWSWGNLVYSVSSGIMINLQYECPERSWKTKKYDAVSWIVIHSYVCKRVECTCCGLLCRLHCSGRSSMSSHQGAAGISDTFDSFSVRVPNDNEILKSQTNTHSTMSSLWGLISDVFQLKTIWHVII